MPVSAQTKEAIKASLAETPGAVIEYLAKEHKATPADVIACLPEGQVVTIAGDQFQAVMGEISKWGDITFLVHTDDIVFEAKGSVPEGSMGRGYYNLNGRPIGGHLKADNCTSISFVSRPLFDNDTHSVQFFNAQGGCMFKIYLGRDENRKLIPEQVDKFRAYRDAMQNL